MLWWKASVLVCSICDYWPVCDILAFYIDSKKTLSFSLDPFRFKKNFCLETQPYFFMQEGCHLLNKPVNYNDVSLKSLKEEYVRFWELENRMFLIAVNKMWWVVVVLTKIQATDIYWSHVVLIWRKLICFSQIASRPLLLFICLFPDHTVYPLSCIYICRPVRVPELDRCGSAISSLLFICVMNMSTPRQLNPCQWRESILCQFFSLLQCEQGLRNDTHSFGQGLLGVTCGGGGLHGSWVPIGATAHWELISRLKTAIGRIL